MSVTLGVGRIVRGFEVVIVRAVQLLLMIMTAIACVLLYVLLLRNLPGMIAQVDSVQPLQEALQRGFGGVLVVLLGLELLDTLKTYFTEHHIRVEVILIVALIAVGRHIIQLDFEHTEGVTLLGVGGLMFSLAGGYFLIKKARFESSAGEAGTQTNG